MADTNTRVQGPVTVKNDSAERVAYDLYQYLKNGTPEQIDKALELYARCLVHVTQPGTSVEDAKKLVAKNLR